MESSREELGGDWTGTGGDRSRKRDKDRGEAGPRCQCVLGLRGRTGLSGGAE